MPVSWRLYLKYKYDTNPINISLISGLQIKVQYIFFLKKVPLVI